MEKKYVVGALLRGNLKNQLKSCQHHGAEIDILEVRHGLESEIIISGNDLDVRIIDKLIRNRIGR